MSLTGSAFLSLIVALTVASFVAVVVAWPRLAGPHPRKIAARVGMLLGVNAMVLLTAATQINAQFLFFADWTDLRGALGGSSTTTALNRGSSAAGAAGRAVAGGAATAGSVLPQLPANGVGSNGVISYTVTGPLSGITGRVVVRLPPGYTAAADRSTRYPVLETFAGYPGSPAGWITKMDLGGDLDIAVAAHRMRSALIVSPEVEIPAGVDTECVNGAPGSPQIETWLARDIPNWVTHTFRVSTERGSWATIGLSAGGWCAAMVTMLHPAQFGAAVVLGGYFRPEFGSLYEPYPVGSPLTAHYDLLALARRDPPPVAIWLETSHSDPVSYGSSAAMLKAARPPLSLAATVLQHAGHRLSVWQGLLPSCLDWLGANIPGFTPSR